MEIVQLRAEIALSMKHRTQTQHANARPPYLACRDHPRTSVKDCSAEDSMERLFKDSGTIQRFRSGPLGPYVQQLADELLRLGHARNATRLL
jgi:hypothetical protein